MAYESYEEINSLPDISMIAGNPYTLQFTVKDQDGVAVHLTGKTVKWTMAVFGNPDVAVLSKNGVISGTDDTMFSVSLVNNDTKTLDEGVYIHQPIIIDIDAQEFRPAQGQIIMGARINNV